MSRVVGSGPDGPPALDPEAVAAFFERRADRIDELGPTRAVIYQDKHPDLAERRDAAERAALLPLLDLDGSQRLLDLGCGTGRWVSAVRDGVSAYHGVDLTARLVEFARERFAGLEDVRFTVASVEDFTLASLGETVGFDRVLSAGVLIYLNDDQLVRALASIRDVLAEDARVLFREPVAQDERLSIVDHFSDDLDAVYNAIYRTRAELMSAFHEVLGAAGLRLEGQGFLFEDGALNNRAETRQEWFAWGGGS